MAVTVSPEKFALVEFEAPEIAAAVERVSAHIDLAGRDVEVDVNESSPLGRVELISLDPIRIEVEGGALEDPKQPRHLSPSGVELALGVRLFQASDHVDDTFGAPPLDTKLTIQVRSTWDIYGVARLTRAGVTTFKPRWIYHFRNRHGFTDAADTQFDRLWTTESLTFADLEDISSRAQA